MKQYGFVSSAFAALAFILVACGERAKIVDYKEPVEGVSPKVDMDQGELDGHDHSAHARQTNPHSDGVSTGMASPHGTDPHAGVSVNPHAGMPVNPHAAVSDNPHAGMSADHPMLAGSGNVPAVKWILPEGWNGEKRPNSAVRLADFRISGKQIECSLYTLTNQNLGENINMWRSQIGLQRQSEQELDIFLRNQETFQTANKKLGIIIDLRPVQPKPDGQVILNAIIPTDTAEAFFLKLTGAKPDIDSVFSEFKQLATSIEY